MIGVVILEVVVMIGELIVVMGVVEMVMIVMAVVVLMMGVLILAFVVMGWCMEMVTGDRNSWNAHRHGTHTEYRSEQVLACC